LHRQLLLFERSSPTPFNNVRAVTLRSRIGVDAPPWWNVNHRDHAAQCFEQGGHSELPAQFVWLIDGLRLTSRTIASLPAIAVTWRAFVLIADAQSGEGKKKRFHLFGLFFKWSLKQAQQLLSNLKSSAFGFAARKLANRGLTAAAFLR
jgi:hypothetical protein